MNNYELLTKQAYRFYFWAREESRNYRIYSVRRERLVLLASRAFLRYERRLNKEFCQNRENTTIAKPLPICKPRILRACIN